MLGQLTGKLQIGQDSIVFGHCRSLVPAQFLSAALYSAIGLQFGLDKRD